MEDMELIGDDALPCPSFWKGRRVLLTGHSGFKGGWLTLWLHSLGAKVVGLSLPPNTSPDLFSLAGIGRLCESHFCDIRAAAPVADIVRKAAPEVIFHLAAQPLVRASYREPVETFATNVMGSVHVLEAARELASLKAVVMVTTDKVYRNNEWPWPYREDDSLGGHDPYSASKAACEIAIGSYRSSFFAERGVAVASARAGNVIGGGDWSADRLIPDAVRAWQSGQVLDIRRPLAIRPWQHVLDPLAGYLRLAERLLEDPALTGAYNFGPLTHEAATVREVTTLARMAYGHGELRFGDGSEGPHEAGWLALETAKARTVLGMSQRWDLERSVRQTMNWYREQYQGADAYRLCLADIEAFRG